MKLWVIRHAKSSWADAGQTDFERPLNKRGNADGPRMAAWLAEQSAPASWIWTSDAARALATSRFVAQGFTRATAQGATPHIVPEHRLYHATPEAACDVLRQTPDDVENVAVVAHNPGLTWLVNLLGGEQTVDNLPTFGVARFNVEGSWEQFDYPAAMLELLMAPKQLP